MTAASVLYWKEPRKLVIPSENRAPIVEAVEGARLGRIDGAPAVIADHLPKQTKQVRRLGLEVTSPMSMHYRWPIAQGNAPFDAQLQSAPFLTENGRAYNLSDMGTGKTLTTLWSYDYLRSIREVRKMLVVAPKSVLLQGWLKDIRMHLWHLRVVALVGTAAKRRQLLETDADVYLINHDGLKVITGELMARRDIDLVALDETTALARRDENARWSALNAIVEAGWRRCWGMSAAPRPNAPTDIWAACRLITPWMIDSDFERWRALVMDYDDHSRKWIPRDDANERCFAVLQPSIRFTTADCMDLPPCMTSTREVDMSREQQIAYSEMRRRLQTELEREEGDWRTVTAVNASAKIHKLVQICCGTVITDDYEEDSETQKVEAFVSFKPRLDEVLRIIEEAEAKVIVFVPYVKALARVAEAIRESGITVGVIHGKVPDRQRNETFDAFKEREDPHVLVAQPACMAHGHTLVVASVIVWFAPVQDNDIFAQANGRVNRPGQKRANYIIRLQGSTIEESMYDALDNKGDAQSALLKELRGSPRKATEK